MEHPRFPGAESELPGSSIWQQKPWWCQPWSILLSGVVVIAGSWLLLHRLWITAPLTAAVLLWWLLFLVLVPAAWAAERMADGDGHRG